MNAQILEAVAKGMVASGRGILAADESTGTMTKRLEGVGVESNEENRRTFRELLVTTPDAGKKISGVILYDETIKQKAEDGKPFPEMLNDVGILPGIKVDTGAKPLAGSDGETVTEGLDGLRERFEEYKDLGAKFAKWRGVINIGDGESTDGDPSVPAAQLRALTTNDGNVLLFNVHLSSLDTKPIVFPNDEDGLPDKYAQLLFDMSSPLTDYMISVARQESLEAAQGARGFVFNGDPVTVIQFSSSPLLLPA